MRALCAGRSRFTSSTITAPAVTYRLGRTPRTEERLSRPSSGASSPYQWSGAFIIDTSAEPPESPGARGKTVSNIPAAMGPPARLGPASGASRHRLGRAPDLRVRPKIKMEGPAEACFSLIYLQIISLGRCVPDLGGLSRARSWTRNCQPSKPSTPGHTKMRAGNGVKTSRGGLGLFWCIIGMDLIIMYPPA